MPAQTSTLRRVRRNVGVFTVAVLGFGCRNQPVVPVPPPPEPGGPELVADADAEGPAATPEPEITDLGITAAVARELLVDDVAPAQTINVETHEGIVHLTGTVDNLLAKTRAGRIAEVVRGVRSVSNRIVVESEEVADPELADNVRNALRFDPVTEDEEIEVAASDGRITLDGTLGSWAEKQLAEKIAASVRGVEEIENTLDIRYEGERSDEELHREIEGRLAADVLVDAEQIDVRVDDSAVTLTGVVGSAAERTRAAARAWTAGVTAVDIDALEVRVRERDPNLRRDGFAFESEAEIADAITDAMLYDPRVASFNVRPVVNGTSVTLQGSVDNLQAKRAAEQLARNTVGVARVVNEIVVEPGEDRIAERIDERVSDEQAANAIRSRLLTNIYTDSYDIRVDVDDGIATLTGTVDTYLEKAEADDVASLARGVTEVDNRIQVEGQELGYYFDPYIYPYAPYVSTWEAYTPNQTGLADAEIQDNIQDELFWSPFVDVEGIEVSVNQGIATLTGTVDSWREREVASENAYEAGALGVANLLHVEPGP